MHKSSEVVILPIRLDLPCATCGRTLGRYLIGDGAGVRIDCPRCGGPQHFGDRDGPIALLVLRCHGCSDVVGRDLRGPGARVEIKCDRRHCRETTTFTT